MELCKSGRGLLQSKQHCQASRIEDAWDDQMRSRMGREARITSAQAFADWPDVLAKLS